MRPYAEIKAARQAAILARAPLIPKDRCHCCDWPVPKSALWCATACAQDYEAEKAELLGAK